MRVFEMRLHGSNKSSTVALSPVALSPVASSTVALSTVVLSPVALSTVVSSIVASPSVSPVDGVAATTLGTLGVLLPFRNHCPRVTPGTHEMRLANDTPSPRAVVTDLEVTFGNSDFDVMDVEHDIVFRRILDHPVPSSATQPLPFRACACLLYTSPSPRDA